MNTVFIAVILVLALLLILIIMVQNPKGGGLDSSFGGGGGSQLGGVQSTNKFLDRATWTLAISLFALILLSNVFKESRTVQPILNTDGVEVTTPDTNTETPNNDSDTQEDTEDKSE
jgi:preprotein translocase subunit SecG